MGSKIILKRDKTLDKFQDLYDTDADIVFLWGGRDLGKSDNLARVLCDKCMRPAPFKCILLREIQDTVLESNYEEIKSFIFDNNLDSFFTFTKLPMKIVFIPNGNSFLAMGGDKPRKLKGVKNPTHLWAEEADGIKQATIQTAIGSLRQEGVKTQAFFTFNPELDKQGKMMILEEYFYPHDKNLNTYYDKNYTWSRNIEIDYNGEKQTEKVKYLSIHGNADDNPFCPPSKIAFYETFNGVDSNKYNCWRWGRLGDKVNERPFFRSKETDHLQYINESYELDERLPILLTFDFNYSPCTVIKMQFNDGTDQSIELPYGLHIFEVVQVVGGTELLCDELIQQGVLFHPALIDVTGDNSARQKRSNSIRTDKSLVEEKLNTTFDTNRKVNARHADSRLVCNYWLVHGVTYIYTKKTTVFISDLKTAEIDETGGLKKDRKDHCQDAGDAFRYGIHRFIGEKLNDVQTTIDLLKVAQNYEPDYHRGVDPRAVQKLAQD